MKEAFSENKKRIGVIFDLDGTLWDSSYEVGIAWTEAFVRNGVPIELNAESMAVMMGRTVPEIGEVLLPDIEPVRRAKILNDCCEEETARLNRNGGMLYDGVSELIPELAKEYPLFIVSNCEDGYIQSFMNYHGTAPFIKDIECIGRTGLHKGDNIKLIVERNGLERAVYIGDTERDMRAAHSAGLPFIRAAYGFGKDFEAEMSIASFRELPETIKKVFKE
ncbi:MAG: HAD family hydrolase [Clostridia bacterium]|nr:HAD family hydrolase [Clostridia bacterium]